MYMLEKFIGAKYFATAMLVLFSSEIKVLLLWITQAGALMCLEIFWGLSEVC